MAGWAEDWRKKKPKTLINEPLSAALKQVDQAWARLNKNQSTGEFQLFGGVLVQALAALDATEQKCNPKLHKQGLQELGKIRTELNEMKRENTDSLRHFVEIKKSLRIAQDRVIAGLDAFVQTPTREGIVRLKQANDSVANAVDPKKVPGSQEFDKVLQQFEYARAYYSQVMKADAGKLPQLVKQGTELAKQMTAARFK